jgi:hypothetical protein
MQPPLSSPEGQWMRTVDLTQRWLRSVDRLIAEMPRYWEDLDFEALDAYRKKIFGDPMPIEVRWKANILASLSQDYPNHWRLDDQWKLGIFTKTAARWQRGDVALVLLTNGMDRHPIWCVSSKGKRLAGLYTYTDRLGFKAPLKLVECPDELVGKQPTDPAAQEFVISLRAGLAASG